MIKKLAWNTFKNTGNINTAMEMLELEKVQGKISVQGINTNNAEVEPTTRVISNINTNFNNNVNVVMSNDLNFNNSKGDVGPRS